MELVQLRPKRQLTVPEAVAEKLDLKPGDYLEAKADRGRLVFTVKEVKDREKPTRLSDMIGIGKGSYGSVEEIDAYIREGRDDDR